MGMTLRLGVIDMPYPSDKQGKTTGDVAEILEAKYHPMEVFAELHMDEIAAALADGFADAVAQRISRPGTNAGSNIWGGGTGVIEDLFKEFISMGEMDALGIPGIPTEAARRGVNHRLKHPYARRGPRPSFKDTSLYMTSFKATVEVS